MNDPKQLLTGGRRGSRERVPVLSNPLRSLRPPVTRIEVR
jgi:hypothetical protein